MRTELFKCRCSSHEHIVLVEMFDDSIFVDVHLHPLPFWKRLKNAFKYVLGYRSVYGDFDEIILDPKDYKRIAKIAAQLKLINNKENADRNQSESCLYSKQQGEENS